MKPDYEVVIIGAGHNSLVAANYLAKAGLSVGVFERRKTVGGIASTEELIPGYHFNSGLSEIGNLSLDMVQDLNLEEHDLEFIDSPAIAFAPLSDGKQITLWADHERTLSEMASVSTKDAAAYSVFLNRLEAFTSIMGDMARRSSPSLKYKAPSLLFAWAKVALRARKLGGRELMELLRVLPMDLKRFLDEQFEDEALKGLLGADGLIWLDQGPRAAGTSFMLMYQQIAGRNAGYTSNKVLRGGVGKLSDALARSAKDHGVDIHLDSSINHIQIEHQNAVGVILQSGEDIRANIILSGADPIHTYMELVGAPQLEPRVVRRFRSLKMKGTTASLHLALSALPDFPSAAGETERLSGSIVISPSLDYAEKAHDDAKYGRISQKPILDVRIPSLLDPTMAPEGKHAMSISYRYAPFHLRESDWETERESLAASALQTLKSFSPGINKLVIDHKVITPLDYEKDYGLTEGSITHGQMGLDQLLLMRPTAGFAGYRGPIENLYLCGSGSHPGGGITGAPGRNAAKQVLQEI